MASVETPENFSYIQDALLHCCSNLPLAENPFKMKEKSRHSLETNNELTLRAHLNIRKKVVAKAVVSLVPVIPSPLLHAYLDEQNY